MRIMGWCDVSIVFSVLVALLTEVSSSTVQLTPATITDVLANNEIVFVNFYADWCRFSQMLAPVYEEASNKVAQQVQEEGKIVFGKVDCDKETSIAQQYHVSKYPTLKLFRHGQLMKREYRGQRSADALATFITDMLKSTVNDVQDIDDLDNLDRKKRHIVGFYDQAGGPDHDAFLKIASQLRDDCQFHTAIGPISEKERIAGNKVVYKPPGDKDSDMIYSGQLTDINLLTKWMTDKCVPLVREITFENAEELTEEGLPFLILFHDPADTETPEVFKKTVARDLIGEKSSVNFLVADGVKFSHPLYHLGKTKNDLPVLAIDSFRHMYLWKHNPKEDLEKGALLKQFIADLHSGKLHREFHHGPDKVEGGGGTDVQVAGGGDSNVVHLNVQKQVMMTNGGVRVQVVRLVQVGQPHKQVDIAGQLKQLAEATGQLLGHVGGGEGQDTGPGEDKEEKGPGPDAAQMEDDEEFRKAIEDLRNIEDENKELPANPEEEQNAETENTEQETGKENDDAKEIKDDAKENEDGDGNQQKPPSHPPKTQKAWNKVQEERRQQQEKQDAQKLNDNEGPVTVISTEESIKVEANYDERLGQEPQPPDSIFRRLGPSKQRYTILNRDEL